MISVVLAPAVRVGTPSHDVVVRSLAWLVSAVVAGVVRDVVVTASAAAGLGGVADAAGCALVEADTETERLAEGVRLAKSPRVLVLPFGFTGEAGLIDELERFDRTAAAEACAFILPAKGGFRLGRRRPVGIVASRRCCLAATTFAMLPRRCGRAVRMTARLRPVA